MKQYCIILASVLIFSNSHAQWSVLKGDPRINQQEAYLYQAFTPTEWNASNFATPEDARWHADARYGMFIHFGLSAYVNKDMSWPIVYNRKAPDQGHGNYPDSAWQKTWPSQFTLEKFNAREWVTIAQQAGMKYIVVIAKHHDGFHMWDTKYSDFKITNTPFKRDYLKELIDACHAANMPIGLYYSQRDWYHPDYAPVDPSTIKVINDPPYFEALPGKKVVPGVSHKKYIEYQFNVVRELCTRYGKIDIFWFDAVWWGGMFTADMWDSERLTRMIRELQPGILINNRASLPGDFDTPEQRIGMYQQRAWESAMTLNGSWAYSPSPPVKPAKQLLREMLMAAAGNGNVLLSWGALFNGQFDTSQKDTLIHIGTWLKQYGHTYYGTRGGPWLPSNTWGGSVHKGNKIYVYVFNWPADGLSLPALAHNKITQASYLNIREKLQWSVKDSLVHFAKPAAADNIVTILELTTEKPVQGVADQKPTSLFDDPAFGVMIANQELKPESWKKGQYVLDLGKTKNITGVGLYGANTATISISTDGKKWETIESANESVREISLTTFMTGVKVPGRKIRFIRIQSPVKNQSAKLTVFAQ